MGTSADGKIDHPKELFPASKILEDVEIIEYTTEVLRIRASKLSNGKQEIKPIFIFLDFMNYLRSVLQSNFLDHEDHCYLMVSCPRVIAYELLVVDFAIKFLDYFGQNYLFKRASLEHDFDQLLKRPTFE